jgi:hypothetical protein
MEEKLINLESNIELIENNDAEASISLNPLFQWAKIVVTDDEPNANKQRVPRNEFDNLVRTGVLSPVKMDIGKISDHEASVAKPIGVISQLMIENNKVIALAALWKKERSEDIRMLKEMYLTGTPPQVSWELSFAESQIEDGIENLKGIILNGLAIVASPAYAGRTPFIAMASQNQEEVPVEELEQLKTRVTELESAVAEKETQLSEKEVELNTLKEYKANIEKETAEAQKLSEVKQKFVDAGIEKDEAYFTENKVKLLEMEASLLDFVIQEMVSFASSKNTNASTHTTTEIPNITNTSTVDLSDPKALAKALKDMKNSRRD